MKLRRVVGVLGVSIALVAPGLVVASTAGAASGGSVARYQLVTYDLSTTVNAQATATYNYQITVNPCTGTGSFSATGDMQYLGVTHQSWATINGTFINGELSFTAEWLNGAYSYTIPATQVLSNGSFTAEGSRTWLIPNLGTIPVNVTGTLTTVSSTTNHGDFVSQNPGVGSAMSCIGMPVQSASE